jgi:hypothetical protein
MGQIRDHHLNPTVAADLAWKAAHAAAEAEQERQAFASDPDFAARHGEHFDSPTFDPGNKAALEAAAAADLEEKQHLAAWLNQQEWSAFAKSLAQQFYAKGMEADSLSPKQWDAARSMKAKCDTRAAEKTATQKAAEEKPATGLDLTTIPAGYYAVPDGTTRLKVRINHVTKGNWAGHTFVDDGAAYGSRRNYGRQTPGGTYKGDIVEALQTIAADPAAASAAYGRLVGRCGICNRPLEDADSVARGIGPICAENAGW